MTVGPIARLVSASETLDPDLRAELRALGASLLPALIALLADTSVGWGRCHAADLLLDLDLRAAIRPLLDAASADISSFSDAEQTIDQLVSYHIHARLKALGSAVIEPTLAFLAERPDDENALYLASDVLANVGIKDERIFQVIERAFHALLELGTDLLVRYGDARAVPLIERAIFDRWPDISRRTDLLDLLVAHRALGAELPPEMRERADRWIAQWEDQLWIPEWDAELSSRSGAFN